MSELDEQIKRVAEVLALESGMTILEVERALWALVISDVDGISVRRHIFDVSHYLEASEGKSG